MMSNEKKKRGARRPYKLAARARQKEAVRERITLAAMHLHETVGPARTTMNAIAERAGVQRATVYNHFPTELDLIEACSSHWFMQNPPPDPAAWLTIEDPIRRVNLALRKMYAYYHHGREMLEKVLQDAAVVPAMDEIRRQKWLPLLEGIADTVVAGFTASDAGDSDIRQANLSRLRASLRVALDFFTWRNLAESGLSREKAADLATSWIAAAMKSSTPS